MRRPAREVVNSSLSPPPPPAKNQGVTAIQVNHLSKSYGRFQAVNDISFEVAAGTVFALLGRNGAGKTTTIELLTGFQKPDAGTVRVLGLDPISDRAQVRGKTLMQLADYATMRALAFTRETSGEPAADTILSLFDGEGPKPERLTAFGQDDTSRTASAQERFTVRAGAGAWG